MIWKELHTLPIFRAGRYIEVIAIAGEGQGMKVFTIGYGGWRPHFRNLRRIRIHNREAFCEASTSMSSLQRDSNAFLMDSFSDNVASDPPSKIVESFLPSIFTNKPLWECQVRSWLSQISAILNQPRRLLVLSRVIIPNCCHAKDKAFQFRCSWDTVCA